MTAAPSRNAPSLSADTGSVTPLAVFKACKGARGERSVRLNETFRRAGTTASHCEAPVLCALCSATFCTNAEFASRIQDEHGGKQRYRHQLLHFATVGPRVEAAVGQSCVANFTEFHARSARSWPGFTEEMMSAMATSRGLLSEHRWAPRK